MTDMLSFTQAIGAFILTWLVGFVLAARYTDDTAFGDEMITAKMTAILPLIPALGVFLLTWKGV